MFIATTDAEAEAPVLWPPVTNSQLVGGDSGKSLGLQGDQASQS